jgi:ABC-2 type transport system ATP-binding protein
MTGSEHGLIVERAAVVRGGRTAIADLSLSAAPGQALAVIGRTGAGKSSLVAALATALPLATGDIRIEGCSIRRPAVYRQRLGHVPHGLTAWPHARADEFLELFAMRAGLRGKSLRLAVGRGLEMAGIASAAEPIDELPAGRSRRLLFARGLLHDPSVLVVDDPFQGLDPAERRDIERLFADMHLGGRIVVAAIDDAAVPGCFTHVAVLDAGRLAAHGPSTPAAFDRGRTWRHRIVCPASAGAAAAVLRRLAVAADAIDDDTVLCRRDPATLSFADLVAALVRAGIPVETADHHPAWTAQLVDDA